MKQTLMWLFLSMALVRERRHQQPLKLYLPTRTITTTEPLGGCKRPFRQQSQPSPSPTIKRDDLVKLSVLGQGSSCTVYKVQHLSSKEWFALKVLHLGSSTTNPPAAKAEAEILEQIDSKFIVKCHDKFESPEGNLCFLMELMERGSLYDVLAKKRILPENAISRVANNVLHGLHYLQGMQIVHGDIKPSNLLINNKGDIKIADFGVSKNIDETHITLSASMGTYAYMSPERVDPEKWGYGAGGFAADVWSLGVVVLECLVGHYPLVGLRDKRDWADLVYGICHREGFQIPETASPEFKDFVERCLEKDWRRRGTVGELLGHPFVNKDAIKGCDEWFEQNT